VINCYARIKQIEGDLKSGGGNFFENGS
jgi:hypothetical protein